MDLKKKNNIAAILPIKSLKELKVGEYYNITSFRRVNMKYGLKIAVDIDNSLVVFLPHQFVKFFEDEEYFQYIVKGVSTGQLHLKFLGKISWLRCPIYQVIS